MIKCLLVVISLSLCAMPSHAQSLVQYAFSDAANPIATFTKQNTTPGGSIVALAGCDANSATCNSFQIPTDPGNNSPFTLLTTCTATNVGTAVRTNVYISSNITGGQKDAVSYVGSNVQLIILELSPNIAVDQKICGTGALPGGGTATSGNITSAHTAELALGLGTAAPISSGAFHSPGSGWTVAFGGLAGSQIVEYQNLSTTNTVAAIAPVSGGTNETYAMAEVTFYTGSASSGGGSGGTSTSISTSNLRVQGTACEIGGFGGGAGSATCFLSGVKAASLE